MSDYTPQPGDQVRVIVEGIVREGIRCLWLRDANECNIIELPGPAGWSSYSKGTIVAVEPIEAAWQPGDIVRDADGLVWNRTTNNDQWSLVWAGLRMLPKHYSREVDAPFSRPLVADDVIPRPLTLLVRDGKAVTE